MSSEEAGYKLICLGLGVVYDWYVSLEVLQFLICLAQIWPFSASSRVKLPQNPRDISEIVRPSARHITLLHTLARDISAVNQSSHELRHSASTLTLSKRGWTQLIGTGRETYRDWSRDIIICFEKNNLKFFSNNRIICICKYIYRDTLVK